MDAGGNLHELADDFPLLIVSSESVARRMETDRNYCTYTRTSCPTISPCLYSGSRPHRAAAGGKFAFVPYGPSFVPGREIDGFLYFCLGQFTRNYTQTVKRAADNKRRYAPGEGSIPPVLLSGVSKGVPPLAHDFACKV